MSLRKTSKAVVAITACIFFGAGSACAEEVRSPAVAGTFYPADKALLQSTVDHYLSEASVAPDVNRDRVKVLVVPHAGYVYSGKTAAYAYKLLQGRKIETVILIGLSHRVPVQGASVWAKGQWKTPLGTIPVNDALAEKILSSSSVFSFLKEAHLQEHSLETQLPFLQRALGPFKIVPIVLNDPSFENTARVADAIAPYAQSGEVVVVVSTDMSHYYPDARAREMDARALELLKNKNADLLLQSAASKEIEFCGIAGVLTGLQIAQKLGPADVRVLDYSNSGDATGDHSRVVGYGALAMSVDVPDTPLSVQVSFTEADPNAPVYNAAQRKTLLTIARKTVEQFVSGGKLPDFEITDPALRQNRGVFVTLKANGQLRGCIGSTAATEPLWEAVRHMSFLAATQDHRFRPVTAAELKSLHYEVSVLSPFKKVRSTDEIVLGRDGVTVRQGTRSGLFLPQVAGETLWTKEQFLNELCSQKAGLPADCWRNPKTEITTFTAEVFAEEASA